MKNSFMAGSIVGSKQDRKRANDIGNIIAGVIITTFLLVLLIVAIWL